VLQPGRPSTLLALQGYVISANRPKHGWMECNTVTAI